MTRLRSSAAPLLLIGFVLAVWASLWSGELTVVLRDISSYFYPLRSHLAHTVQSGTWPWWNPWLRNGLPFFANPETGLFYPLHFPFYVLPLALAFNWTLILHYVVAATGFYTWLRSEKRGHVAAATGAALIVLGGFGMTLVNYPNFLQAFAWMGWVWWTWNGWLRDRSPGWLVGVASGFALQFLAGEPQIPVITTAVALLVAWTRPEAGRWRRWGSPAVALGISAVASMALAAVQLVPTFELLQNSGRAGGLTAGEVLDWSATPLQLTNLVLPAYFDGPGGTFDFLRLPTPGPPWVFTAYLGAAALALSFAAFGRGKRRADLAWLALGVLGVLVALGEHNPVLANVEIPSFARLFRYPQKMLVVPAIALPYLASSGVDAIGAGRGPWRVRVLLGCGVVCMLAVALSWLVHDPVIDLVSSREETFHVMATEPRWALEALERGTSHAVAFVALLALVVLASLRLRVAMVVALVGILSVTDLWLVNRAVAPVANSASVLAEPVVLERLPVDELRERYRIRTTPIAEGSAHAFLRPNQTLFEQQRVLTAAMSANRAMIHRVLAQDGVEAFRPVHDDWRSEIMTQLPLNLRIRYLRLSSTAYGYERTGELRGVEGVAEGPPSAVQGLSLYRIEDPLPRAYLVRRALVEPDSIQAINRLLAGGEDPHRVAYVSEGPGIQGPPDRATGSIQWLDSTNHTIELAIQSADSTFLVLTDTAYPGWEVAVDGRRDRLVRANWHFKGVYLAPGEHVVRFTYRPTGIVLGGVVSLVTLLALIAVAVGTRGRFRDPRGEPWAAASEDPGT